LMMRYDTMHVSMSIGDDGFVYSCRAFGCTKLMLCCAGAGGCNQRWSCWRKPAKILLVLGARHVDHADAGMRVCVRVCM
jgi:hypothetical protein